MPLVNYAVDREAYRTGSQTVAEPNDFILRRVTFDSEESNNGTLQCFRELECVFLERCTTFLFGGIAFAFA